ncbi:MAG: hypothetical protein IJQ80_02325 [Clostridia bacterium]|nr:hypothetical protein [Clostridia bacterium]
MTRDWKKWIYAAGVRAVKTVCQVALSYITIGAAISEIDWKNLASVAIVAGVYSLITSLAGLPELEEAKPNDDSNN